MIMLTKTNAKIVISPIDHFSGPRLNRRTWRAELALLDEEGSLEFACDHHMGHRTIEAATKCGREMWKRLPAGGDGVLSSSGGAA